MPKAAVIGKTSDRGHSISVKNVFLNEAPSNWECDIYEYDDNFVNLFIDAVALAVNNNCSIIIHPYSMNLTSYNTFLNYIKGLLDSNFKIFVVNGIYNNDFDSYYLYGFSGYQSEYHPLNLAKSFNLSVQVGGGINQNVRNYGIHLEMYDYTSSGNTYVSYTVASVAAKIAKLINDYSDLNYYSIRALLRQKCDLYQNGWNFYNGYGKPVNPDPQQIEPQPPLFSSLYSFSYMDDGFYRFMRIKWFNFKVENFVKTIIINSNRNETLYEGTDEFFDYYNFDSYDEPLVLKFYTQTTNGYSRDDGTNEMIIYPYWLLVETLPEPGKTMSVLVDSNNRINISFERLKNAVKYRVYDGISKIYEGTDNSFSYYQSNLGPHYFRYCGVNAENREGKLSNYYGGITLQSPPPVGLKGINVINDRIKFNFHNLNDVEIYKDETLLGVSSNGVFETVLNNPYGQYKFKSKIGNVYNNREENLSLNNLSKLTKEGLGL